MCRPLASDRLDDQIFVSNRIDFKSEAAHVAPLKYNLRRQTFSSSRELFEELHTLLTRVSVIIFHRIPRVEFEFRKSGEFSIVRVRNFDDESSSDNGVCILRSACVSTDVVEVVKKMFAAMPLSVTRLSAVLVAC